MRTHHTPHAQRSMPIKSVKRLAFSVKRLLILFNLIFVLGIGQEVYLRLTDYGGGKINLVIEQFTAREITDVLLTKIGRIKSILRNDLDYSLYFDILPDTTFLLNDSNKVAGQGILLTGSYHSGILSITLTDFQSHERIATRDYSVSGETRSVAHAIADDVIKLLTGEKGIFSTKITFSYKTLAGKELAIILMENTYYFLPMILTD
jgi:hypothetical protein